MSEAWTFTREIDEIERRLDDLEEDNRSNEILKADENALTRYAASVDSMPATRGAWTLGNVGYTSVGQGVDSSGNGNHLTNVNGVDFTRDGLMPYAQFVRAGNMALSLPDGGAGSATDILCNEAFIPAAEQGLSICGWAWFDALAALTQYTIASKWATGTNLSWIVDYYGAVRFGVRTSLGVIPVATSAVIVAIDTWYWIEATLDRAANIISITVNDNTPDTTAIAAATILTDSSAAFQLGGKNSAAVAAFDGRLSGWNYAAARAGDNGQARYQNERAGFGV